MSNLSSIFSLSLKRRSRDFFIIFYNLIFPMITILLLGYLNSLKYTNIISSYEYYTIALIPFFVFLSITTSAYNAKDESMNNVSGRVLMSPTEHTSIVLAKISSSLIVLTLTLLLLLFTCNLFFTMQLGKKLLPISFLYLSFTFMTTAIGYFIGFTLKNDEAIRNYMNLPISIFAFLGGSFFPVGSMNPSFNLIFQCSPLHWINKSIFLYIYDGNVKLLQLCSLTLFGIGLIFLLLSLIYFKREVFM